MAWFMLRGFWPATPTESRPYDLLLDTPSGVKRIQVKTTTCMAGSGSWQASIGRHAGGGDKHNRKVPYRPDEADLFAVIDGDFTIYLIPVAAVAGRVSVNLRSYSQFIVGSAASMFRERSPQLEPLPLADNVPAPVMRPDPAEAGIRSAVDVLQTGSAESRTLPGNRPAYGMRWNESYLRAAAANATSWADLLRQLGYQPSSTGVRRALQHDVQRYGIDTSHFVAQRTWSNHALIEAAATAHSWNDLLLALGLSPNSRSSESVRAAARRLGVELGHFTLGPKTGREAIGIDLPDEPGLGYLRNAAPNIAAAWFLACGRGVSTPCEPEAYDLVVDTPDGLQRVQVKTTTSRDARGNWGARIGHRPDGSPRGADLVPYRADEVDQFLIVDGDLLLYVIPAAIVRGKTSLSLRNYRDLIVGEASSLLASINPIPDSQDWPMRSVG
jgi:PD-(D/E)XK endonuclease